MGGRRKIASQKEVLSFLTNVMRRDIDEDVKLSEAMSAADKLYRYFRETSQSDTDKKETGVVILPQVNDKSEKG